MKIFSKSKKISEQIEYRNDFPFLHCKEQLSCDKEASNLLQRF